MREWITIFQNQNVILQARMTETGRRWIRVCVAGNSWLETEVTHDDVSTMLTRIGDTIAREVW